MTARHIFALLALALVFPGCSVLREELVVPPELIGVWGTTDPRYEGRTFEFTTGSVIFQTGNGPFDFTAHPIQDISIVPDGNRLDYVVEYGTIDAGAFEFSFSYLPDGQGMIRFMNQPEMIWTPVEPDPAWY